MEKSYVDYKWTHTQTRLGRETSQYQAAAMQIKAYDYICSDRVSYYFLVKVNKISVT